MADTQRWQRIETLFHDALEAAPEARAALLRERCGVDDALRREVEELLAADAGDDAVRPPSAATLATALETRGPDPLIGRSMGPWRLQRLLGAGGMGRVYLAEREGEGFRQRAAVKLIRAGLATDEILARFRHERATLARLQHPGIARLLDGGSTPDELPWLAMEHVEGQPLDDWCDAQRLDVRARLELFARVADAVAFAHGNLVVHRDLKPGNILVDAAGAPHLLDFGIARVLDASEGVAVTAPGSRPFTPAYASPEQIRGEPAGTAADVHALGVILHELLTGRRPFRPTDETAAAVERAVLEQEPERPSSAARRADAATAAARRATPARLARQLAGDLDNIVLRALAKEPGRRYASVADLAADVRRHLAGHPVEARAPTVGYRVARFVRRHVAASVLGGALLLALAAFATQAVVAMHRDQARLLDILRLSDSHRLAELKAEMDGPLWPARPERAPAMDAWLTRARELLARRPLHEARLAALSAELAAGARDEQTLWWHAQLSRLVEELSDFAGSSAFGHCVAAMEARRRSVDEIQRASLDEPAAAWDEALASIADPAQCPSYTGLRLTPQWGLAPLRRDPASGLWEFRDVQTGAPPALDAAGGLVLAEDTALVFVLLPGGRFVMGAQAADPQALGHDALADVDESPLHEVALQPFFLSKWEMTQGQWLRATGANPSDYRPPTFGVHAIDARHPVEQMSWDEAQATLRQLGLLLPTEAQWEYACRAGTSTPWWTGAEAAGLDAAANLADLFARGHGGSAGWSYTVAEQLGLDDGHTVHAAAGSFRPNAFGLHDVHGNVWEWCRDVLAPYKLPVAEGDGARLIPASLPADAPELAVRAVRGGAFSNPPARARSSSRWSAVTSFRSNVLGVRPARAIEYKTAP